jgi:hypothetical protein
VTKRTKPITILGHNYTVVRDKPSDEIAASGRLDVAGCKIIVATNLCRSQATSTTLHEIIEAINWHCELNLEHPKIMTLETALYDILTTNGVKLDPLFRE